MRTCDACERERPADEMTEYDRNRFVCRPQDGNESSWRCVRRLLRERDPVAAHPFSIWARN